MPHLIPRKRLFHGVGFSQQKCSTDSRALSLKSTFDSFSFQTYLLFILRSRIETLNKPDVVAPILKSESTPVKPEATTQPVTDSVKQQESAKSLNTTQSQPVSAPSIKSLQTKEKLPDPKILKPAPLTPSTFSLDSLFKSKKPVAPIDYDIPLQLWKNLPSNNGLFLIRRNENIWNMIHENNIDLARAAEVGFSKFIF